MKRLVTVLMSVVLLSLGGISYGAEVKETGWKIPSLEGYRFVGVSQIKVEKDDGSIVIIEVEEWQKGDWAITRSSYKGRVFCWSRYRRISYEKPKVDDLGNVEYGIVDPKTFYFIMDTNCDGVYETKVDNDEMVDISCLFL